MSSVDFSQWLGRQHVADDSFQPLLINRIAATFDLPAPCTGSALPLLWHWCFFNDGVSTSALGVDGHPIPGDFLPPADGRQRMWAGSRIEFSGDFIVGASARRCSTVSAIEEKHGRNGSLLFVTVRHEYTQNGKAILQEEQDIVYREPSAPRLSSPAPTQPGQWSQVVDPSAPLLFRYSAITFNTHRIHYDWPYATEQEGYPGLVVHGPLLATLLLQGFVRANPSAQVKRFTFRGVRPLIVGEVFDVSGCVIRTGEAIVWAATDAGVGQEGTVEFD